MHREVRPSWRGGALLRWQPLSSRGGVFSFMVDFVDTCLKWGEVAAHSPTLGTHLLPLGAPSLRKPCTLLCINKELSPSIC
jgi:hypothetical protein